MQRRRDRSGLSGGVATTKSPSPRHLRSFRSWSLTLNFLIFGDIILRLLILVTKYFADSISPMSAMHEIDYTCFV